MKSLLILTASLTLLFCSCSSTRETARVNPHDPAYNIRYAQGHGTTTGTPGSQNRWIRRHFVQ